MKNEDPLPPAVENWLRAATADAERRGLPALRPLLESLARSTAALRAAAWNWEIGGRAPRGER